MTVDFNHAISLNIGLKGTADSTTSSGYIPSHTTGDIIEGVISITSSFDVSFDDIQISVIGEQYTNAQFTAQKEAHHRFLNIVRSVEGADLPNPRILRKKHKYCFDFAFEVLDILPPSACLHTSASPLIRAAHLQPPPSFGDGTVSRFGGKLRDDFAPETCKICYTIQVKLSRVGLVPNKPETILVKKRTLRIKPALNNERTFSHPDIIHPEYCLHWEQTIYTSRSRQTLGRLSVTLEDGPIRFWLPSRDPHSLISKAIRIFLVYQPTDPKSTPPELDSLEGRITATTFYTTMPNDDRPLKKKRFLGHPINFRNKRFPVFTRSASSVHWTQSDADPGAYSPTLLVPVTLPRENLIPTFHSCLISRVYTLNCRLTVRGSVTLDLVTPVLISAKADPLMLPSYDASVALSV